MSCFSRAVQLCYYKDILKLKKNFNTDLAILWQYKINCIQTQLHQHQSQPSDSKFPMLKQPM